MIWVVPCKYDPIVFDCVASIREHHPDDRILVVDSMSPDRSYLETVRKDFGCEIADVENQHWPTGAYEYAYRNTDDDFYALIQDSLIVHANLHHLQDCELTTVRYFRVPPNQWDGEAWAREQAAQCDGLEFPDAFVGVFGPMWFCQRSVLDRLDELGLFRVRPTSRLHACAMERLAGIALTQLGYDPTVSLQGEMHGFFDPYDTSHVEKFSLNRA